MPLFLDNGFEATTVDQVVEVAGISRRSFFRYFATKEDVVLGDLLDRGRRVQAELARRPAGETPWEAVRGALLVLRDEVPMSGAVELQMARMLHGSPSLRARRLEKQLGWQELLVPALAQRLDATGVDGPAAEHRAAAIVASALVCLDTATETWLRRDGAASLEDLWDEAVAAVRA